MRALVLLSILAVVVIIAAIMTGYVNITNVRGEPPALTATRNSVSLKAGRAPSFDVEAGSVKVGTKPTTVNVPTVQIQKPRSDGKDAASNNRM